MLGSPWLVLVGVAIGIVLQPELPAAPVIVGTIGACIALTLRRRPLLTLVATLTLGAGAGWLSAHLLAADGAELRAAAANYPRCRVEGRVLEDLGGLGTSVAVTAADCAAGDRSTVVVSDLDLPAGRAIAAEGWLRPLDDRSFDRARAHAGADAELVTTTVEPGVMTGAVHRAAHTFRGRLDHSVAHLTDERRGLILGMTIGDTSRLPHATNEQLRRAGLTHLLAVSGSNVALVVGVVALALRRSSIVMRLVCSGAALAFYVLVVGPQPSVLRAGAMGAIVLAAFWRGVPTQTLHVLGLALVVLLLVRPGLLFSVGLHLSAAATAGIVLWAMPIADRCSRLPRPAALALGATLAAQFAVVPILLATFGEFSLVAPLANVLAFPLVAPITILGLGAGAVALAAPGLAAASMSLLSPLAGWVIGIGKVMGDRSWAAPTTPRWLALPAAIVVTLAACRTLTRRWAHG